jgi:hypothetical protein
MPLKYAYYYSKLKKSVSKGMQSAWGQQISARYKNKTMVHSNMPR